MVTLYVQVEELERLETGSMGVVVGVDLELLWVIVPLDFTFLLVG